MGIAISPTVTIARLIRQSDPCHRGRAGFVAGIAAATLVAAGLLVSTKVAGADSFPSSPDIATVAGAGGGPPDGGAAASSFGGVSEALPPAATPAPAMAGMPAIAGRYAALGDSVAAGLGLAPVANPSAEDAACGRSSQSYAYEVGRQLNRPVQLVACSGATAGDLLTQQHLDGPNPRAQLSAAYAAGTPALISITAGANDVRWQTFISRCYAGNCGDSADSALANAALLVLRGKLLAAMEDIRLRARLAGGQPPRVVLTGYYNPFSSQCLDNPANGGHLTQAEIGWLDGTIAALNQTISDVAGSYSSFARFAPADFSGHDLCSTDPWIQGLADKAPLHPTAAGQQTIARSVVSAAQ